MHRDEKMMHNARSGENRGNEGPRRGDDVYCHGHDGYGVYPHPRPNQNQGRSPYPSLTSQARVGTRMDGASDSCMHGRLETLQASLALMAQDEWAGLAEREG